MRWRKASDSVADTRSASFFALLQACGGEGEGKEKRGGDVVSGVNLVMTVIGFAVSTMFIVFVCSRLICARIQLRASRRSFQTASGSDLSIIERGLHGLEPVLLSNFPIMKFGDLCPSIRDIRCAVCLSEYQEKDVLRVLPYCAHAFHVSCIDLWLKQHSTCPVCRISLRGSPYGKRRMSSENNVLARSGGPDINVDSEPCFNPNRGCEFSPLERDDDQRMDRSDSEPSTTQVECSVKASSKLESEGKAWKVS
ncbi:hypothetical protein HPP92_011246 [Vanilla planifolia]|uniref:RING-type E3 ubiquitin transferase n=1 Tax=Vanilla planifolia TaxID=51239 RepID=A0A835R308_VANPL|nr:hypothetical protein HPP92_011518 [Vanilla planifolia]KAG0483162.1 hypothetical protein HPP92_011246 [Vanilla planifolia]